MDWCQILWAVEQLVEGVARIDGAAHISKGNWLKLALHSILSTDESIMVAKYPDEYQELLERKIVGKTHVHVLLQYL